MVPAGHIKLRKCGTKTGETCLRADPLGFVVDMSNEWESIQPPNGIGDGAFIQKQHVV